MWQWGDSFMSEDARFVDPSFTIPRELALDVFVSQVRSWLLAPIRGLETRLNIEWMWRRLSPVPRTALRGHEEVGSIPGAKVRRTVSA